MTYSYLVVIASNSALNGVTRNIIKIFVPAYIINVSKPLLFKTSSFLYFTFCSRRNLGTTVYVLPR
jgi:hypothetical protein